MDENSVKDENSKKSKFGIGFGSGFASGIAGSFIIGVVILFVFSFVTGNTVKSSTSGIIDEDTAKKADEINTYIETYYYEDFDEQELKTDMLHGLADGLGDPYTVYYTAEEYADLQINTTGQYYGIGAGLTQDPKTMEVTITKIYEGTPSEEAGLKKGDKIVKVDDIEATSMELTKLVQNIRGQAGTTVHLEIERPSTGEKLEFDVERKNVTIASVESEMLENNIGYIQISEFQTTTGEQFDEQLTDLENQGMKGLIIDLRGNPGGLVDVVTDMTDRLLPAEEVNGTPAGTVVYTADKNDSKTYYGEDDGKEISIPVVVLVDENSASASEIMAGALKDYTENGDFDATLVGTTTFGKGIVQSIFNLKDGDAIKITTAKYYTPNGNNIHGVGITPDYEIQYEYSGDVEAEYDKQYDNQFQKAVEVMNEKLQ